MEPAIIDWKLETARARYVRDEVYENINAPRWTDLTNPDAAPVDDEAWFCRPDCRHPKTAEDFKRWTPSPKVKKLLRSSSEASPLGDKNNAKNNKNNTRDASVKPRGGIGAASSPAKPKASTTKDAAVKRRGGMGGTGVTSKAKFQEDLENKDPNIGTVTPPGRQLGGRAGRKLAKEAIKSSAEKRDGGREEEEKKVVPRLRSTMSARNLFSGKDILRQISEFCNELKRMAMRKDRVAADVEVKKKEEGEEEEEKKSLLEGIVEEQGREGQNVKENSKLRLEDEGSTLQNVNQNSKNAGTLRKSSKVPLRVDTGKEKWKKGVDDKVLREVRANPPTPQRFSPSSSGYPRKPRAPTTTNSPLNKPPKSTNLERGEVLQDIAENNEERTALIAKAEGCNKDAGILEVEGRSGDMFWFFKPCSYLV